MFQVACSSTPLGFGLLEGSLVGYPMSMKNSNPSLSSYDDLLLFFLSLLFIIIIIMISFGKTTTAQGKTVPFNVGLVLNLEKSSAAAENKTSMMMSCISTTLSDFYSAHSFYSTRLILHTRDSNNDNIGAASAALDLLKNMQVQAIIGPETSTQANFMIDLGDKSQVPIVSFSATSPFLSSSRTPYFIRTSQNDSSQINAITSIVQAFAWKEIIPIYEDTEYGNGMIPYLSGAFQEIGIKVPYRSSISPSATDREIWEELNNLIKMQTTVFIVHMNIFLGSRIFNQAKEAGMMNKGYAWIITDKISNLLHSMDSATIESMQGVLGVRPYVPRSKELDGFKFRLKKKISEDNPNMEKAEPSIYELWAYDTVWALAMAAEEVGVTNNSFSFLDPKFIEQSNDLAMLGVSQLGPKLLAAILKTEFRGLSGQFRLVNGQLQSSVFQILNVIGNEGREIGLWTPKNGILRELSKVKSGVYSGSASNLRAIIWPGESINVPIGWAVPNRKPLRVGVPVMRGFYELVMVDWNRNKNPTVTGYCIDVFNAVMKALPYDVSYEFVPFAADNRIALGDYNDLIYQVYLQNFDVVVGDITILPERSFYVDFTLPCTETGVSMIVRIEDDGKNNWVFLKPLSRELWLISVAAFIFTGCVIWILEHRINTEFRGSPTEQIGTIFWFAFSTIVFAHRERLINNLSRLVLIIWIFVVLILSSSYTASLTTKLTVQQLSVSDINQLIRNGDYVGYQQGSFVKGILKRLHIDESKFRGYNNHSEYAEALSRGSQKGGVAAIFDEIPYLKLFLSKYCDKYAMVGPTYNTEGFGFVFRKGSPLVLDVSKAISDTQVEEHIVDIDLKWFRNKTSCQNPGSTASPDSLTIDSFRGLFLITIITSLIALLIFFGFFIHENMHILTNTNSDETTSILQRLVKLAILFYQEDKSCSNQKMISVQPHEQGQVIISRSISSISSQDHQIIEAAHQNPENGISSSPELDSSHSTASSDLDAHTEIRPTT